ncbi:kinase-like protein [Clavulina sp. PMI_390]|nr:kinase-like protein [Clavulina sp. PMI_390]
MATVDATNAQNTSESLVADTYSLTDNQLADSLEFIEEIGFGNWGSVWSCRSRIGSSRRKLAVKLVHRTAERTTAARVRSLWNEMKIVRTLKDDRHPAIIDFHSFVITPSYALITMEYLPRLVPVEVREPKAKLWFESLLGGIAHLHARGIVHNDIKPANILLSRNEQPVLVDFGFAEKYELLDGAESFSSLAYGTPEYLSPERARGYKHDTRKSDVWSLGVTFFEIITGRTPFEVDENEEFTSKEDLERYWTRTNSGEWVGTWKMSSGLERVLRKMLRPNVIERASAADSLRDAYFTLPHIEGPPSLLLWDPQAR